MLPAVERAFGSRMSTEKNGGGPWSECADVFSLNYESCLLIALRL